MKELATAPSGAARPAPPSAPAPARALFRAAPSGAAPSGAPSAPRPARALFRAVPFDAARDAP